METITNIITEVPIPFLLAATGIILMFIYLILGILIHASQKWWCYATITKTEIPWVWLILTKISLHKLKVEPSSWGVSIKVLVLLVKRNVLRI